MADPQNAPNVTGYLQAVPTDNGTRAQAWEAFSNPANQQDFEQRIGKLNLPSSAKADLWEAKYGSGRLNPPTSQAPNPSVQPKPQVPAQPAPTAGQSFLSRAWDWANKPVDIAGIRQTVEAGEARANAPATLADAQYAEQHPILSHLKTAYNALDYSGNAAAKALLTPLSVALTATGGLGEAAGAVGTAAKAVGTAAGVGFGVKAAKDQIQQGILPKQEESAGDYIARTSGNLAMMLGGGAAVAHAVAPHPAPLPAGQPESVTATPPSVEATPAETAPVLAKAQARVASVVGGPKAPVAQTIHVDPAFASELDSWNQSKLPGKRVILKTDKAGNQTVNLAHSNPDVEGFQYTNTEAPNTYSTEPDSDKIPVSLSKSNGVRATAAPGHFLANSIGANPETPVAGPELGAGATAETTPVVTPQTESPKAPEANLEVAPATPAKLPTISPKVVEAAEPERGVQEVKLPGVDDNAEPAVAGGIGPGRVSPTAGIKAAGIAVPREPLPPEIAKSSPNYGYGNKNFKLDFEDPHDKAAYTLGQLKDNKAQGKFVNYLQSQYPDASLQDLKDHALAVRSSIKDLAKISDPKEGPLKIPSQGGIATSGTSEPVETAPQTPKPAVDVTPLEDKIRPLVGQAIRLKQLQVGEAASDAIDTAINQTHSLTGSLDPDLQQKIGSLLKEPVGPNLTPDQITRLEQLRGAQGSTEPTLRHASQEEINRETTNDPDAWQRRLDGSMVNMTQAINDPATPPELKAKLTKAMLSEDREGNPKPWLYESGTLKYPEAEALDPTHPEAPFTSNKLGNDITPISLKNYTAILGKQPRDLFLGRDNPKSFVTPEENANYAALKDSDLKEASSKFDISDITGSIGNEKGSVISRRANTSQEFRDYDRELRQQVLARKIAQVNQDLKTQVGQWNNDRQANTPLTDQLSKLAPEVRKYLPQELFDYERPQQAASGTSSATPGNIQAETPNTSKTSRTSAKAGTEQETPVEGIRTTKFDSILQKKFPDQAQHIDLVQKAVEQRWSNPEQRQPIYDQAMKAFHEGVVAGDPFAVKRAIDATTHTGESGFVGAAAFTPEEVHTVNSTSADAFLSRWEAMSDSELLKKKDGLMADSLVKRIEGSAPTSDDPIVRQAQADTYNELLDRHRALRAMAGPTTNLHDTLSDWANNFIQDRDDKRIMREVRGTQYRNDAILKNTFDSLDKLMNALPVSGQARFFDNMSRGTAQDPGVFQDVFPKFLAKWEKENGPLPNPDDLAARIRQSFDAARQRVTDASGKLDEFIVNYMPGMYENQAQARNFSQNWAARRPLEGGSEFLKQKMYEFHSDALKAGLQPVTDNPVRAMMMRVEQLNRFAMAHEFKNKLVQEGFAAWYNTGDAPPVGHEPLNDKIFGQGGIGGYFAPSRVARTFNNFVSTGLTGAWRVPYTDFSLYDGLKSTNNLANQMQLGLSVFHGVETTLNSGFTTMAKGLRQVINEGKIVSGVGNIAKGSTFIAPLIEDAWNGSKGLINFRDPTQELNYAQLGNDLETANANVYTQTGFQLQQIEHMKKNWATATDDMRAPRTRAWATAKAAGNLLSSGVEATSWPLMNYLIPRVKLGAFYKMSQQIHEEMVGQPPEDINSALQKAWDSVDNRFGQVNYDNMFMNKTVKDIMSLSVRSPGWNIGTLREVGGGAVDLAKSASDLVQGKGLKISNRTAYTAAMVAGTMYVNSIYNYLHTGQMPQGMDYFFPKDGTKSAAGEENRVYPKTYVYDFINLYHAPLTTAWHKAAPDISTVSDLIRNEDYYHHEIRDPGNSPVQNAASTLGYMAHQFVPFSFGNLQEAQLRGQSSKAESFMGILPAPRWAGRTAAENLAYGYFEKTQGSDANDAASLEKKKDFIDLRNKVKSGTITDDQVQEALDKGKLNPKMIKYLYESKSDPQIINWTKNLRSSSHVMNVWNAATPEEKKILLPTVMNKIVSLDSGPEQEQRLQELEDYSNKN